MLQEDGKKLSDNYAETIRTYGNNYTRLTLVEKRNWLQKLLDTLPKVTTWFCYGEHSTVWYALGTDHRPGTNMEFKLTAINQYLRDRDENNTSS